MRKYWLTLGTILAGMWGVSNAFQRAEGQDLPRTTIVSESGTIVTGPGPAPVPTGTGAFFYSGPTMNALVAEFGGEGMSEEMQQMMHLDGELETRVQATVAAYSDPATEATMREDLRNRLTELLEKQFDARQMRREWEIKQIEERVKKLREALEKRTSAKEKIIERRLNDLLTDAEGLGWGDAAPGAQGFNAMRGPYGPMGGGSPYGPSPTRPPSPYGPVTVPGREGTSGGGGGSTRGGGEGRYGEGSRESQPAPSPQPSVNEVQER